MPPWIASGLAGLLTALASVLLFGLGFGHLFGDPD